MKDIKGSYQIFVESNWQVTWVVFLSELILRWKEINTEILVAIIHHETEILQLGGPLCTILKEISLTKQQKNFILGATHKL